MRNQPRDPNGRFAKKDTETLDFFHNPNLTEEEQLPPPPPEIDIEMPERFVVERSVPEPVEHFMKRMEAVAIVFMVFLGVDTLILVAAVLALIFH